MERNKTVIFDFDGTLANTLELVAKIYNEHAQTFGARQIDMSELDEYRKLGYKRAMKKAGIRWTVLPRLVLFVSREMKSQMAGVKPYKGIVEVLKALQEEGFSIGVLTSNDAELVQDFFVAHGFPHFDFVVSEKTMFGKEKALRRIMKRHGLKPKEVIYVGDEPRDITASHKAGITVVGVTWGVGGRFGLAATPPDKFADTMPQLKKAIEELSSIAS
jgi:phosphoglycolate phosphatase